MGLNKGFSRQVLQLVSRDARMWNEPTLEQLKRLPRLYSTDTTRWQDKLIYEHFFIGGCDWYAAEFGEREQTFFGYAILNDDLDNSEWGYFALNEMRSVRVRGIEIDRDLHWTVRKASEVDRIVAAQQHQNRMA